MNGALYQLLRGLNMRRPPLHYCCQICNVRTDSRNSVRRNRRQAYNPGIENRLQILKEESPDFDTLTEEETNLDDFETDFMGAHKMHKEYEREKKAAADALAYVITKSKHFKPPKLPNLLMWTEKDQIRSLHQLDAIEWSPEKLAQRFPATPEVVKKLIKSHWKPKNDAEIERHDRSVEKNWASLLKGKFNLDPELKRHFLSFSARQRTFPKDFSSDSRQIVIQNKPQGSTEFSDIVKDFSKDKGVSGDKHLEVSVSNMAPAYVNKKSSDPRSNSFVVHGRSYSRSELLPLKEYKEKVLSLIDEEDESDEFTMKYYDHLKIGNVEKRDEELQSGEGLQVEETFPVNTKKLQKYQSMEGGDNLSPQQLEVYMKAEQYKLKIRIPEDKFDPSAVYKVKDCFYDADGKFLYRVPGMS